MNQETLLMELEEAVDNLSCGLNAVLLMVIGLEQAKDPYADGFHAIWMYLQSAEAEVRRLMKEVSTAAAAA